MRDSGLLAPTEEEDDVKAQKLQEMIVILEVSYSHPHHTSTSTPTDRSQVEPKYARRCLVWYIRPRRYRRYRHRRGCHIASHDPRVLGLCLGIDGTLLVWALHELHNELQTSIRCPKTIDVPV